MKTDKHNMDLGQLLADMEHAGRDARRRDELATMIDQMAGNSGQWSVASGQKKHGFWWWGARVAAAACILFFISTAVRIWFIPTEPTTPLVAEAEVVSDQWPAASVDSTIAAPAKPVAPRHTLQKVITQPVADGGSPIQEETVAIAEEEALPVVEDLVAEEVTAPEKPVEEAVENPVDDIATPVVSVAYSEPQAQPQEPARRRNILSSLFRQPEPDEMTGTVLAFRIL